MNTDGQLGLGHTKDVCHFTKVRLPEAVVSQGLAAIRAGGDTSALVTEHGAVWSWGNSEYAQAMHGRTIDQIPSPRQAQESGARDVQIGGSSAFLLDCKSFWATYLLPTSISTRAMSYAGAS